MSAADMKKSWLPLAGFKGGKCSRDKREKDDAEDKKGEVLFYLGNVAENISAQQESYDPAEAAQAVKYAESPSVHLPDSGYEWSESPDDGKKAGDKDGLAAVFIKKILGAIKIILF